MTHRYVELFTLSTAAGAFGTYQFKCNGMFDPNTTGTGHQPMGYDQMTPLYKHWYVIGSRIYCRVVHRTSGEDVIRVALYKDEDTTITPSTMDMVAEQTPSSVRLIPPNSNNTHILKSNWSLRRTFGGGAIIGNERYRGTAGADPPEQTLYTLAIEGPTVSNTDCSVEVSIDYIAVWNELNAIGGS